MSQVKYYIIAVMLLLCMSCQRGQQSNKPPIHAVHDMDHQPKYKTQAANPFFADKAAMRMPVKGTVASGRLDEDDLFYQGLDADGKSAERSPLAVTADVLAQGRTRFSIYCTPCHSPLGDGQGVMVKRGFVPPPSFQEQRLRESADGYIFGVISNGIRNMPSHAHQVPAADRWAIVAFVRSLQAAQQVK
jgi:mono/diheme cytochrome c family protein